MNEINYEERCKVYDDALAVFGETNQLVVALEELSEVQKEICKFIRGDGDLVHLEEEVADATIMLEQVRRIFGINTQVCQHMDAKISRLESRISNAKALSGTETCICCGATIPEGRQYCPNCLVNAKGEVL